jgi:hypothetical protein
MPSKKKPAKENSKDSQLIIRISASDRVRFISVCNSLDTSAAREIRRFIRDFLNEHPTQS